MKTFDKFFKQVPESPYAKIIAFAYIGIALIHITIIAALAITLALYEVGVITSMDTASTTWAISILASIFIGLYIIAIYWIKNYPNRKPGFFPAMWILLFGFARIGWDRPGIKNLPWKAIIIGISVTSLIHFDNAVIILDKGLFTADLLHNVELFMTTGLISIVVMYLIGSGVRAIVDKIRSLKVREV